jgi:hypothetical protein
MDCFELAWTNSIKNDYKDNISTFHKGIIPYFLKNNPTLLTLSKIVGDVSNLGAKAVSMATQGVSSGSDQMSRLEDDTSQVNRLIDSMKEINHRVTLDIKAVSNQKIIYLSTMNEYYKNFILALECAKPTDPIPSDTDLGYLFNKHFKKMRSSTTYFEVDNMVTNGPGIISTHCRNSISTPDALNKILKYMSIPSALIIRDAWKKSGLRNRCYEVNTTNPTPGATGTIIQGMCP